MPLCQNVDVDPSATLFAPDADEELRNAIGWIGFTSYNDDCHLEETEDGFKEAEVQLPTDIELRPFGQRNGKLDFDI